MGDGTGSEMERDAGHDASLIEHLREGQGAAATTLYRRHVATVRFVVMDNVRDPDDVDDVVQEVFARAFARIDQLADPGRFRSWLLQIARRAAIDVRRARVRRPQTVTVAEREFVDLTASTEMIADATELAESLRNGLAGLSLRDRTVLSMTVELGFSLDDVAAALDITHGNAKVVLHRARRRLRRAVEPALAVG